MISLDVGLVGLGLALQDVFAGFLEKDIIGREWTLRVILRFVTALLAKRGLTLSGDGLFVFIATAAAVVFGHDDSDQGKEYLELRRCPVLSR